ncbi:tRNA dihydrouridine synthase DusB [candidate division KSB1 bacterium]|nr:tRNA dihydrouridine synthase DusB [candidate division KSB1 bacterium]
MQLGDIKLDGRVILAPLAGVTDSSFRMICREAGAAIVFTEMVSADGLVQRGKRTLEYLFFRPEERPIGFQLFGSNPDKMAKAVAIAESFQPDFIDLNFGCPVKKVVKRGAGAALLKDIAMLGKIAEAAVRATNRPVLAKIRQGWDEKNKNAVEVAKVLEGCGIHAITIHPRTQTQLYSGHSDWNVIREIKNAVSVPVIGNGDVKSAEDVRQMIEETNCDLVMIGRGCLGNPWIFRESNHFLLTSNKLAPATPEERLKIMLDHLNDIIALKGENAGVHELRKHLAWYTKGLPNSTQIRAKLFSFKSRDEIKDCLTDYFHEIANFIA